MFYKFRTNFRIKIKEILKKIWKNAGIVLILWIIMLIINYLLGNMKTEPIPITTYEPHISIMNEDKEVPKDLQEPINKIFNEYVNYCNNQEYEEAYNMLSEGCKKNLYPTQEDFEKYTKVVFDQKKIYNIQNYSVNDNVYIYNLRILNDILATGLTDEKQLVYYEEKVAIESIDDKLYLSIGGFIKEKKVEALFEDEYMKLTVDKVLVMDDREIYTMTVSNKSDYVLNIADTSKPQEIFIKMGSETRNVQELPMNGVIVFPDQKRTYELTFTKWYDETEKTESIIFDTVYIIKEYKEDTEQMRVEKENAIDSYSFELKLSM